jgi:signal peptidase II
VRHLQATGGAALTTNESLTAGGAATAASAADRPLPARGRVITLFSVVVAVVLALDVITKELAVSDLAGREPVRLLGGAVYLLLTRNSGAAFSLGTGFTFVFPIVALVVTAAMLWTVRRLRSVPWALAFGLVLGGTLGNLTDRIFRAPGPFVGHVVDFISVFDRYGQGFPVFNLADSALCVGVGLAILLELTGRRRDGTRVSPGAADGDGGDHSTEPQRESA